MPNDSQDLNDTVCAPNNRKGFMCEDCIRGYAYSPKCMDCKQRSTPSAIAIFLTLKFVPITVMFILMMIFRINITQGPMFGYALYCQAHIITLRQKVTFYQLILHELHGYDWVLQASLFLSSLWVTDYSSLGDNYCISESFNIMDVFLLNFVSIVYLLFLVISTYVFIEKHMAYCGYVEAFWKVFF